MLFAGRGGEGGGQSGRALRALDLQSRGPEFNFQLSVGEIFSTVLFRIHLLGHACKKLTVFFFSCLLDGLPAVHVAKLNSAYRI